ncbi:hypothetical protein BD770DRAFT_470493 [Pilaira anomala]|nr:hypothetical protein BD770DRAFT_470493 [Pilaira anomala]
MKTSTTFLCLMTIVFQVIAMEKSVNHGQLVSDLNNIPSMQQNTNSLVKRGSIKSQKRAHTDCRNRRCSFQLEPCPKECKYSCGYMDSPDPCCPLLGTPTCPEY